MSDPIPDGDHDTPSIDRSVLDRLDELEQASRRREADLVALADEIPAAVSRTALLRSMITGLGDVLPGRRRSE